jgi:hypothetical protein
LTTSVIARRPEKKETPNLDRPLRFALLAAAATVLAVGLADSTLARGRDVAIDSSGAEAGSGEPLVRLSTVNGPVMIKNDSPGAD